jgi:replication initiation protein RepC
MTGCRRLTPEIAEAIALADLFRPNGHITKNRAFAAVQDAQGELGITAAQIGLLGQLVKASSARDWTTEGGRPIVCVSNRKLCRITGMSLRTLQRQLRALQILRLIAPKDSPNGQRKIYRGAGEADVYGFDLSPMAVRYFEILELAAVTKARWEEESALEREFTETRRTIRQYTRSALEEGFAGEWRRYDASLDALLERRKTVGTAAILNAAQDLLIVVREAYHEAAEIKIQPCMDADFGTHSVTTTTGSWNRKSSEQRRVADASQSLGSAAFGGKGFRKKPERGSTVAQARKPQRSEENSEIEQIPLGLVTEACPEIGAYSHELPASWWDLIKIADAVRPELGVSEPAWREARSVLGDHLAAVAVAVILQKHQAGQISKPGGYLRGMTERHRVGELHLVRTLYGLRDHSIAQH